MAQALDLTGKEYGRLTVIRRSGKENASGLALWECLCSCGNTKTVRGTHLRNNAIQSCGCLGYEDSFFKNRKHGLCRTYLYGIWCTMLNRCKNPRVKSYKNYGGRGIEVCKRWENVENFAEDMGHRPSPHHTVERINNDGNYEPSNCRWATRLEQAQNRRWPPRREKQ